MNINQFLLQTYLMSVALNLCQDNTSDPFGKRLARAALSSIPITIAIDTSGIVNMVANKFNINNIQQPENTMHAVQNVITNTTQKYNQQKQVIAYYSRPEDNYKNSI